MRENITSNCFDTTQKKTKNSLKKIILFALIFDTFFLMDHWKMPSARIRKNITIRLFHSWCNSPQKIVWCHVNFVGFTNKFYCGKIPKYLVGCGIRSHTVLVLYNLTEKKRGFLNNTNVYEMWNIQWKRGSQVRT